MKLKLFIISLRIKGKEVITKLERSNEGIKGKECVKVKRRCIIGVKIPAKSTQE